MDSESFDSDKTVVLEMDDEARCLPPEEIQAETSRQWRLEQSARAEKVERRKKKSPEGIGFKTKKNQFLNKLKVSPLDMSPLEEASHFKVKPYLGEHIGGVANPTNNNGASKYSPISSVTNKTSNISWLGNANNTLAAPVNEIERLLRNKLAL